MYTKIKKKIIDKSGTNVSVNICVKLFKILWCTTHDVLSYTILGDVFNGEKGGLKPQATKTFFIMTIIHLFIFFVFLTVQKFRTRQKSVDDQQKKNLKIRGALKNFAPHRCEFPKYVSDSTYNIVFFFQIFICTNHKFVPLFFF